MVLQHVFMHAHKAAERSRVSLLDEIHKKSTNPLIIHQNYKGECVLFWDFRSPQLCCVSIDFQGRACPPRRASASEPAIPGFALSPSAYLKMLLTGAGVR